MGRYEDYDAPLALLSTGEQKGQAKTSVYDALVGAATVINVLTSQNSSPSTLKNSGPLTCTITKQPNKSVL